MSFNTAIDHALQRSKILEVVYQQRFEKGKQGIDEASEHAIKAIQQYEMLMW